MRVLLVEDEIAISEAVTKVLKSNHYIVDVAGDGEHGLDYAQSDIYDVIILDIMLPEMDGITVLKELRSLNVETPVILVSAKGSLDDKILGLDSGADDYLPKPFKMEELLARLRALGRRKGELIHNNLLIFGDLEFNPHTLDLYCRDESFLLTPKESQLLELLMRAKDRIISKNIIIEKIWGYDGEGSDNQVEVYISFLRKKIVSLNSTTYIQTVRGVGYALKCKEDV